MLHKFQQEIFSSRVTCKDDTEEMLLEPGLEE